MFCIKLLSFLTFNQAVRLSNDKDELSDVICSVSNYVFT